MLNPVWSPACDAASVIYFPLSDYLHMKSDDVVTTTQQRRDIYTGCETDWAKVPVYTNKKEKL